MPDAQKSLLDIVIAAIDELGGHGRLHEINRVTRRLCRALGYETPTDDDILQTINHYCPQRRTHLRQGDYFEYCGVGQFRVTRVSADEDLIAARR